MTTKRGAKTAMGRPSDDTTDRAQGFVKVALQIPDQTLGHVLCSALEGGSGYWCQIVGHRKPKTLAFRTHGEQVFPHIDYPMNAGGAVYLRELADDESDFTGPRHCLTRAALRRGLALMTDPKKAPIRHLAAILSENFDAETGDVLLQLSLLGEIKYG